MQSQILFGNGQLKHERDMENDTDKFREKLRKGLDKNFYIVCICTRNIKRFCNEIRRLWNFCRWYGDDGPLCSENPILKK